MEYFKSRPQSYCFQKSIFTLKYFDCKLLIFPLQYLLAMCWTNMWDLAIFSCKMSKKGKEVDGMNLKRHSHWNSPKKKLKYVFTHMNWSYFKTHCEWASNRRSQTSDAENEERKCCIWKKQCCQTKRSRN